MPPAAREPLDPCVTAPCDARCCDAAEVPLLESDVARLQAATGRPSDDFVEAAEGWLLLRGTGVDTGCVFLGDVEVAGRRVRGCTVHAARPEACRHYPFILSGSGRDPRVVRDGLCPFARQFVPAPGTRDSLAALERQLEVERAARTGPDGR